MTNSLSRGQVYRSDLGYGAKPWLIVSNNHRNRLLSDVIAVRITTTSRDLPTWVPLASSDPLIGCVNADCIEQIHRDEFGDYLGALTPNTMQKVDQALRLALAL
jgi:mRNA interferase MazF